MVRVLPVECKLMRQVDNLLCLRSRAAIGPPASRDTEAELSLATLYTSICNSLAARRFLETYFCLADCLC